MGLLSTLLGGPSPAQSKLATLGGVELPASLEPYHLLLAGSTGTGKTTLLDELLRTIPPPSL